MTPYRILFTLAACYNVAFGLWAALSPHSFFTRFELDPPRYPSIWACLGMVIGLYGIAYACVAWKPRRGDVLVWIGLAGKFLGPCGWLVAVSQGELPPRTYPLIVCNDLLWWFPFLFYLLRDFRSKRLFIAWSTAAANAAACVALVVARNGTELVAELEARAAWVVDHASTWTAAWLLWSVASLSLLGFFFVWGARLLELRASRPLVALGCSICALGVLFDLAGETVNIAWLTEPDGSREAFARGVRLYALLGPGIANGLYCVAGLVLSTISWRRELFRGWLGWFGFLIWTVGLALSAAAFADHRVGMVVTGAVVMALFLPWCAAAGWRLRQGEGG